MTILSETTIRLATAIGIGLLIGAERERRKGSGTQRAAAGVRTFTLASVAGALASFLDSEALLITITVGAIAFSALAYGRTSKEDPGLTSEFALLVAVLLGAMAMRTPMLAAALGVLITVLLASRGALHRTFRDLLSEREAHDALVFLANSAGNSTVGAKPRRWPVWCFQPSKDL